MLITLILWWIFWHGWGIGELEGFFFCWVSFLYSSSVLFGSLFALFLVNILLFTDQKKKKKEVESLLLPSNFQFEGVPFRYCVGPLWFLRNFFA